MQYINNNILCLTYEEVIPKIIPKGTYDSLKNRGKIEVHGHGGNGRNVFIEFETMPNKYRAMVMEKYGDVYKYASEQPLLNSIEANPEAYRYYDGYVLPNGDKLPNESVNLYGKAQINYVKRYTQNAEWIDMMVRLTLDKVTLKRELNMTIAKFWEVVTKLIEIKGVALPKNPKRLKAKIKTYQNEGFEALIETHKFGNGSAKKVADEVSESFLKAMIAHKNKHDDSIIASAYNRWAIENSRQTITPATVGYRRKMWAKELMFEREGLGNTANKLSKSIKRDRPTAPLLFINSDDNVLDVYFKNGDNAWYRPVLYIVIDTFNDLIIGWAWGDSVTDDVVKEAFRNANRYVMHLTGDAYSWQQLQTDRWHIAPPAKEGKERKKTELERFYDSMCTFTPAGLKNASAKHIERSFGTTWHQVLKALFPNNYSGHNITSKEKLNRDNIKPINFPDISEADKMIEGFVWAMRNTKRKGSDLTRQQEWVESFNSSEKAKKKLLTTEQRLQVFGVRHDYLNEIKKEGVSPTLLGETRYYELSQQQILKHIGKKMQVYYDPCDLSQVLISDGGQIRFLASQWRAVPSAFADYEEGDAQRIHSLQEEKRQLMPVIQKAIGDRKAILERAQIDAESRIQGGVLIKELNHQDQRVLQAGNSGLLPSESMGKGQELSEEMVGYSHGNRDKTAEMVNERGGVVTKSSLLETGDLLLNPVKRVKKSIYDRM